MVKKFKLPKEHLVEPEDRAGRIDDQDVEGHGLPTTAPPSLGTRVPGHGGEAIPMPEDGDEVESHKRH